MERLSSEVLAHIVQYLPKLKQHQLIDDTRFGILCCNAYYSVVAVSSCNSRYGFASSIMPIFSDLEMFRMFLNHYWFFTPNQIIFDGFPVFQGFMKTMRDVYAQCHSITILMEPDDFSHFQGFGLNRFPKVKSIMMKTTNSISPPRMCELQGLECLESLKCEVSEDLIVPDLPKLRNLEVNRILDYSKLNLRELTINTNDIKEFDSSQLPQSLAVLEIEAPTFRNVSFASCELPELKSLKITLKQNDSYNIITTILMQIRAAPKLRTVDISLKGLEPNDTQTEICEFPCVENVYLSNDSSFSGCEIQHRESQPSPDRICHWKAPILKAPRLRKLVLDAVTIPSSWQPPPTVVDLELKGPLGLERIDLSYLPNLRALVIRDVNFTEILLPQTLTYFKMRGCRLNRFSCPQNLKALDVAVYEDQHIEFNSDLEQLTLIQHERCRIIETNFISKLTKLSKFNFRSWEAGVNYNLNKISLPQFLGELTITGVHFPPTYPFPPQLLVQYVNIFDLC